MAIIGGWRIKYLRAQQKPTVKKHSGYTRRNERLPGVGYADYREYLKSEQWQAIRAVKLKKFPQCLVCDKAASQVHHLDYSEKTLLGLCLRSLVTLCDSCHERIEVTTEGEKRRLCDANAELRKLASAAGKTQWLRCIKTRHQNTRQSEKRAKRKR